MLKLQSFVAELGQRCGARVALRPPASRSSRTKPRPAPSASSRTASRRSLRVHLASTNIRDVVHKRLLQKTPRPRGLLRELFSRHRGDLKLYGYDCHSITEEDFVEVYPMLPGHIDLLMQITTNLRAHSTRVQGDDHAIRGLLQLLGELFREQRLGERELGALVTLDAIYEVQRLGARRRRADHPRPPSAHPEVRDDTLALRAAKAVALLELIQESTPDDGRAGRPVPLFAPRPGRRDASRPCSRARAHEGARTSSPTPRSRATSSRARPARSGSASA
jgi:hypothetical protein